MARKKVRALEVIISGDYEYAGDTLIKYLGVAKEVVIPVELDGNPINVIGKEAFKDRTDIVSVVIPDSIRSIREYAFKGCTGLKILELSHGCSVQVGGVSRCVEVRFRRQEHVIAIIKADLKENFMSSCRIIEEITKIFLYARELDEATREAIKIMDQLEVEKKRLIQE